MTSAATAQTLEAPRPVIMFVDDEPRVLKSMRAMFRRDYDVLLANSGAEALEILTNNTVDVVVSDQRMPYMTGVDVLSEIKQRSPETVRILLTGYADLAAVEASINEAEVFKYLMKPCPADEVRGAVQAGLELRASVESIAGVVADSRSRASTRGQPGNIATLKTVTSSKPAPMELAKVDKRSQSVHLMVLSADKTMIEGVATACPGHKVHHAHSLETALEYMAKFPIGVLVTDVGADEKAIRILTKAVRRVTPEVVIILASDRSDANVLIQLINSGQVFRFLLKPLQIGQCKIWLTSALRRFVESGGQALAVLDQVASTPGAWRRFKDWFLGVQT